ncbi:MAG: hypothetical protein LBG17_03190 [Bacteroidales bacterium]|jgi:hypothetical protein|nr:hypothetical protein [Bacteroidales bacterium]
MEKEEKNTKENAEKSVEKSVEENAEKGAEKNAVIAFIDDNMPELSEATDDEKYAAAAQILDDNLSFQQQMDELFNSEPEMSEVIAQVVKGDKSFIQALAENISPEEYAEMVENTTDQDVLGARRERLKKLGDIETRNSELDVNSAKSVEATEKWLADKKDWDEAKKEDFKNKLLGILKALEDGILTPDELDLFEMAFYGGDMITAAKEDGITEGRNAKIDDERLKQEAAKATDALPALNNAGGASPDEQSPKNIFEQAINEQIERNKKFRQ